MRQGVENWEQRHRRWLAAGTLAGTVLFVVNANLIAARADERTVPVTVTTDKSAAKASPTAQTPLKTPAVQVPSSQTVNDATTSRSSVMVQAVAVPLAAATANHLAAAVPTPRTSPDMAQAPAGQSPVAVTTVDPGVAPVNPHQLTHVMTAPTSQPLTHPKGHQEQLTYSHLVGGYNTDLRQVDRYDPQHQVPGQGAWQGETYANGIAQDAKGADVHSELSYGDGSHPFYIDEWLPDIGLQIVLWQSSFAQEYTSYESFRQNFTKAQLASLVDFSTQQGLQSENGDGTVLTLYYRGLTSMHSLEGLQNATHLKTIYLSPDPLVGYNTPDPNKPGNQPSQAQRNGNLWDIRALASLNDLTEVNLSSFLINDISALAHKAQLKAAILDHNQIADISPLATDHQLNFTTPTSVNVGDQHILLTPVTLPKEVSTSNLGYTTPSFIIKNQQAQNLPITGLDSKTAGVYLNSFPTTGAVGNANANTLTWFHLQPDSTTDYGNLTASWSDPDCDFSGIIIQPYALADQVGTVTVQAQALQADGRQLNLGPTALISGTVGTTIDLNDNAATLNLLQEPELSNQVQHP